MSDSDEIEIISDGQGMALIGDGKAIERFLLANELSSREIDMSRFWAITGNSAAVTSGVINTASQVGRWVQVTENSAAIMKGANLMKGSSSGVSRAIVTGAKSKTSHIIEIVNPGKGLSLLTNPAMLAGAAGMLTQIALQQSMEEIAKYLKVIDAKVDDVLQAQKDSVAADMLGAGYVIEEAFSLLEKVGKVSEVTWSKVQGTVLTLARTQAYALLQLDGIGTKIKNENAIASLLKTSQAVVSEVDNWLAVIARCSQLQDGVSVLELDRLLSDSPDDLEDHRSALTTARQKRLQLVAESVAKLQQALDAAAVLANKKTLFNPFESPKLILTLNRISESLGTFQEALELARQSDAFLTRLWSEAALDLRNDVVETSKKVGAATVEGTKKTVEVSKKALDGSKKSLDKGSKWVVAQAERFKKDR